MHVSVHRLFFMVIQLSLSMLAHHIMHRLISLACQIFHSPKDQVNKCSTQYPTWRRYVYDRCISSIVWLDEQSPFVHPDMLGSHLVDQEDRPCHWLSEDRVPTDHSPDRSTVPRTKQTAVLWWFHTSLCGSCPTNKQQYNYSIITLYS